MIYSNYLSWLDRLSWAALLAWSHQLPRSLAQRGEESGDAGQRPARPAALPVRAGDRHRGASGMVGLATNRWQQQGRLVIASR
jgi:hypothetical protein